MNNIGFGHQNKVKNEKWSGDTMVSHVLGMIEGYRKRKRHKRIVDKIIKQEEMIACVKSIRKENKEVVIFGAGTYGHQIYDILKCQGIETALFCDNNKGGSVDEKTGVRIVDVDELKRSGGDYLILLCVVDEDAYSAIEKQLKEEGFSSGHLCGMQEYIDILTVENLEMSVHDADYIVLIVNFIIASTTVFSCLYWHNGILWMLVLFLLRLMNNSADWVMKVFGGIELRTIIFQMHSPLKGTGRDIIKKYCSCIGKTNIELFVVNILYGLIKKVTPNTVGISIPIVLLILELLLLCRQSYKIGIPKYIRQMSSCSKLYEREYVAPDSVKITFPKKKKNLIYIYLESMEMTNVSMGTTMAGKVGDNLIPHLTEFASEHISFSNTENYGGAQQMPGTGWTMAGLLASTSGISHIFPVGGNDLGRNSKFLPKLVNLGDILKYNGYKNYFMCGSKASFAGRDLFFRTHGNYEIFDLKRARKEGVIPEKYNNGFWGMEDSKLYEYAKDKLMEISQNSQPFNFTMLTVDTHHPDGYICENCPHIYSQKYANVVSCADNQIYDFINWIQEQKWYNDTIVVITGDHLSMVADFYLNYSGVRTVYNCFINTRFVKTDIEEKNRDFWVADLFPSTIGALGADIEGNQLGLGVNLFSNRKTLAEKLGIEGLSTELDKNSIFYKKFI